MKATRSQASKQGAEVLAVSKVLSPQQLALVYDILAWLDDPNGGQTFIVHGCAGTGKTTVLVHLAELLDAAVVALTGKAVEVLRSKGVKSASTVHSRFYKPKAAPRFQLDAIANRIRELGSAKEHEAEVAALARHFEQLKNTFEVDGTSQSLVILDECSMIGTDIARDLLKRVGRLIAFGDPAQLPPVKGRGHFMGKPNFRLTKSTDKPQKARS